MRKRTFVLFLVLFSVFSAFAQTFEQGGIFYEVTDAQNNLISLIWGGDCKGDVVLPESVTYNGVEYTIDNIEDRAFLNCSGLTSVVIPEGVIRIGTEAFNGCSSLKSVSFPKSIAEIFNYYAGTFRGCDSLTSINNYTKITYDSFHGLEWYDEKYNEWYSNLPRGIIREGNVVLGYKGSLPSDSILVIPDGVTHIAKGAFEGCGGIKSVTIPASVVYIGESAFRQCEKLVKISILGNPQKIGNSAFQETAWYEGQPDGLVCLGNSVIDYKGEVPDTILIPSGITNIADYSFSGKDYSAITIPSSVNRCGALSFANNSKLTSITLPDGMKYIGMSAFFGCRSLKDIIIPQSITIIGNGTFEGCRVLESVNIPNGVTNIRDDIFSGCDSLESIVLPDGVVIIGEDAFEKCHKLKSVNIPDKVRRIGQRVFYECYSLTGPIVVPEGVKEIANNTFFGCGALTSISIPNGLITIGDRAFEYCCSIEKLVIPESVYSIGTDAFLGCSRGLKTIVVDAGNNVYDSRGNCNALIHKDTRTLILGCMNTVIPEDVSVVEAYSFAGCYGLKTITIPDSVMFIGRYAFDSCTGLESLILPNNESYIDDMAFSLCTGLTALTIPEKVRISSSTFYKCSIEYLDWRSNQSPSSILDFSRKSLKTLILGGWFCKIGDDMFSFCDSLTSVTLLNGVTSIGNCAFMGCKQLCSITIPESVTTIGKRAFENCTDLTDVVICGNPEIGVNAFFSPNITKVTSKSYTPGAMSFNNPFVGGEQGDVAAYGNGTIVYDSTLCRTITKIEFNDNYVSRSCFVNVNNIPAGRYKVSVVILPSPDTIPNVLHPIITGITDNGNVVLFDSTEMKKKGPRYVNVPYVISNEDKYKIDTIVTTINVNGLDLEDVHYKYTYVSSGYDTLAIIDELVVPNSVKGLTIQLLSRNGATYLLLDRVFLEPLDELPSPESYSGPFTENVFNNATLYVPEGTVDAYRAADGWKWFKNIAIDTAVDPIRWDNRNNTGSPVIYDMLGRKVMSDSLEGLQPGLYIINGKKYFKR